jgi:hypothetical protein
VHGGLWAGRLLAAPRFELLDPVLLEPFAYASFVDLSDDIEDSTAFQLGGGASLRLFGRWRAQLEVARVRTGDDYPVAPLTRVFAQVSSAF